MCTEEKGGEEKVSSVRRAQKRNCGRRFSRVLLRVKNAENKSSPSPKEKEGRGALVKKKKGLSSLKVRDLLCSTS